MEQLEDIGDFLKGGGVVGGALGIDPNDPLGTQATADTAAQAALEASQGLAGVQQNALDYLMQAEELPQELRQEALSGLAGLYGLNGDTSGQDAMIQQAISSPLYQAIMSGQGAGEEAILRSASATGGLRSGNVQANLYDYNTQLQNQALLESYNQQVSGLQGLAGLPSMAPQIAQGMEGIGQTLSQGQIAAAQAQQMGQQQSTQNLMGLGQLGLMGMSIFSDRRLKTNIKKVGRINGWDWFSFDWNSVANKLGLSGSTFGTMADIVFDKMPEAVFFKNNFMMINYKMIGVL